MNDEQLRSCTVHALALRLPGWAVIPIGDTGDYINGFPFKPGDRSVDGRPIVRIQNLTDESKPLNRTRLAVPRVYEVSQGDMLVSWSATLDVFTWRRESALVNQHIFKVVPDEALIEKRLLFYWLRVAIPALMETEHLHGSTMKHINRGPFLAHAVPLPPRLEQTRIVDKLEELLSDLDAGVAELKAAQKKLAQYRQSLLKSAVEGQLTQAWRAQQGEPKESGAQLLARILRERRARWEAKQLAKFEVEGKAPAKGWQDRYVEPAAAHAKTLPELPQGWAWARAEQLCDFITKGTTPPKGLGGTASKTVPFLRVTNLTADGTLNLDDKVFVSEHIHRGFLARSVVYSGDVLMNIVGPPLGQVSVVPATFPEWNINQAIAIFRAVNGVSSPFMALCLLSAPAQAWLAARAKTTAGQTNLTLEVCRDLPIALPPEGEQQAVAQAIEAALAGLADQDAAVTMALRQATAQRKNILQAAFSGQLVPQDPNDEPASVLLARIRAERAGREKAPPKTRKPRGSAKASA